MQYAATIDILASPEVVLAILADVERWPTWTPSVSRVERLEPGPLQVGSRARVTQPKLSPTVYTVTRLDPRRGFTWDARLPGLRIVADHALEPVANETTRVTLSVRFEGLLGGLIGRFYGGLTRSYLGMETAGLKRRAEAGLATSDRPLSRT